jgi:hypothetical protein
MKTNTDDDNNPTPDPHPVKLCSKKNWPGCSGDPACCPENEGYGCGKPNPAKRLGCSACGSVHL